MPGRVDRFAWTPLWIVGWICFSATAASSAPRVRVYEKDVRFALAELQKQCGGLLQLKKVDWDRVSKQFLKETKAVKSPQDHLVLLVRLLGRLEDRHASVCPLAKGKNVRWPDDGKIKTGPGMFWCKSGGKILAKNSWASAEKSGLRAGMEIVKVNGAPVAKWVEKRSAELADKIGFSTAQHAYFYTCHWGLADTSGTRLQLEVRDLKGKKRRITVRYAQANPVPWGPAFFPENLHGERDVKYGKTPAGFGYLHVRRCPGDLPEVTDKALAALGDVPGMIVDFRGNSGGGFDYDAFLGRFIPEGKQIAFRKRYSSAGPNPYGGLVVVIVDATVRSAGETGSGVFKEDGRAHMIG